MSSTNVRGATPADAAAIAHMHVRSWQIAYRGLVPDEVLDSLSPAHRESTWQTLLARNAEGPFTFVAERDQIVGFCSIIAPSRDDDGDERTCEVAAVYVDPDHWRAGIGSGAPRVASTRPWVANRSASGSCVTYLSGASLRQASLLVLMRVAVTAQTERGSRRSAVAPAV